MQFILPSWNAVEPTRLKIPISAPMDYDGEAHAAAHIGLK
jgi:hypothetical protein